MNTTVRIMKLVMAVGAFAEAGTTALFADCEVAKLLASDGASGDAYGLSVSVSGDVAVVGARAGDPAGAAYVYRFDGLDWVEEAILQPSDGTWGDAFGYSVAVFGDIAVIGAPYDDPLGIPFTGSAYVFRFDGLNWVEEAKLLASDAMPGSGDCFGLSVAVYVNTAGACLTPPPQQIVVGSYYGAYVFQYEPGPPAGWGEQVKLLGSDTEYADNFGQSVSISGDLIVVGAPSDDNTNGDQAGSAYVFRYDSGPSEEWVEEAKVMPADGAESDYFGFSVSIFGNTAIVGAHGDDDNGENAGSAYVFCYNLGPPESWIELAKLTASDGSAEDAFGSSVSISGDMAVAGAGGDCDNGAASGSAYVFEMPIDGWEDMTETVKLTASDAAENDLFGLSVSISADNAIIGAPNDDDNGEDSGSAYVFYLPDCIGCAGDVDGDGDTDLSDLAALLGAYGSSIGEPEYNPGADFDSDGDVDLSDLAFLLADYGCTV